MPQTIEAAQAWLAAHPNDKNVETVKANLAAAIQARTNPRPDAPRPKPVSTISPPGTVTGGSSVPQPLTTDEQLEASRDKDIGQPGKALHYIAKGLPTAGSLIGGSAASILGLPAGPAAIATGAVGAGVGQGAGRYGQMYIDDALGYQHPDPESLDTAKQVLKEAAVTSAMQAVPGLTGLGAGKYAASAGDGKARDFALWWAKNQGAMTPAKVAQIKGTQLETVSPESLQELIDASTGGKGAVPAAATIADKLRTKSRIAGEVGPALRGAPLDQLDDDAAQQLLEAANGGGENTPAAASALASDFRRRADLSRAAKTAAATAPAEAGTEMAPAGAKALAGDYRRRAQISAAATTADALAPERVPDMAGTYAADARSGWLSRHLPTAESGADAITNLPGVEQSVRQANLAPLNDDVIQSIRSKLSGETQALPPAIDKVVAGLSPEQKAAALKQLGINMPTADPEAVQNVFDNLRSNVAVAGDASFQGKATKLLDAGARERALTDTLQSSRGAAAQARGTFGQDFTPSTAAQMGVERAASADAASRGYAGRDLAVQRSQTAQDAGKVATAFDATKSPLFYETEANNLDQMADTAMRARDARDAASKAGQVRDAFGAQRDPLYYDTQANILDNAATAGTKAQGAMSKAESAGVDPSLGTQYGTDSRSLDAFVAANTDRGLKRSTDSGIMSVAALAGNRVRHAFAESSPWSAGGGVPKMAAAARSLEAEVIARGMPASATHYAVDPALNAAMQAPNDPAVTRAAVSALSSWLYGPQQQQQPQTAPQ